MAKRTKIPQYTIDTHTLTEHTERNPFHAQIVTKTNYFLNRIKIEYWERGKYVPSREMAVVTRRFDSISIR